MKLNSPNPSWLTQLTCSLNPNQVLQKAHLNRTAPGPIPQSRLQNTRGKIIGQGDLPVPSPKTTVSLKPKSRTLDPKRLPQRTCNLDPPQVLKTTHHHRTNPSPTLRPRLENTSQGTPGPTNIASQSSQQ